MQILVIIDVRWWNACAYYAVELARGLAAAGEEVVVAGSPEAPPVRRARALGLEVWTGCRFADRNPGRPLLAMPRLAAAIRRRRFDLIDAHRAEGHVWGAMAARLGGGPPLVRTRGDIRPPRRHAVNRFLHRRLTAAHVVPSRFMARQLVDSLGVAPDRVHRIPAGIDVERFRRLPALADDAARWRSAHGIPAEAPLVAVVARLSPIKGHRVVLAALARLAARHDLRPWLAIIGQDEEITARELTAEAASLGLAPRVVALGRLDDVRPPLAAADLHLVPSLGSEAICRVLLEGMAMSVPAVASRVGVIGEIIAAGRTGVLVTPGDVEELAAVLAELFGGWPRGRARLGAMGEAARRLAEDEYSHERWVGRARALYREVAARRRARREERAWTPPGPDCR